MHVACGSKTNIQQLQGNTGVGAMCNGCVSQYTLWLGKQQAYNSIHPQLTRGTPVWKTVAWGVWAYGCRLISSHPPVVDCTTQSTPARPDTTWGMPVRLPKYSQMCPFAVSAQPAATHGHPRNPKHKDFNQEFALQPGRSARPIQKWDHQR